MNILINFATLKKGGGQNVGLNFLAGLSQIDHQGNQFVFAVVGGTEIYDKVVREKDYQVIKMPSNPLFRMIKELLYGRRFIKKYRIDIIYSYFGIGLYPFRIPQVSGSADSNIFFPEIDFWAEYHGFSRLKKKIIDAYRIWGLKQVRAIVFENEVMEERGKAIFNLQRTICIKPSISTVSNVKEFSIPVSSQKARFKGLFFCGWQRNKNFIIIPRLAKEFARRNIDFHFFITAPADNSIDHKRFIEEVRNYGVENMVSVIGVIKKEEIASLLKKIDFIFLLSKLESFSNNIIESWFFKKTLVISDALWAKSICKDSAIYVDRDNPKQIADIIECFLSHPNQKEELAKNASQRLASYPTIRERTIEEIDYLKTIFENG